MFKKIRRRKKNKQIGMMIFGGILGFLAAPLIVPLFAGAGLYGAAAYSSGLAALGGGSLASGGFGMAGGALVLKGINIGIMMILESQIKMPEGIKNIELEDSISAKYCEIPKYRYFDYIFDKSGKLIYEGEFQGINLANKGFIYFEGKKI